MKIKSYVKYFKSAVLKRFVNFTKSKYFAVHLHTYEFGGGPVECSDRRRRLDEAKRRAVVVNVDKEHRAVGRLSGQSHRHPIFPPP